MKHCIWNLMCVVAIAGASAVAQDSQDPPSDSDPRDEYLRRILATRDHVERFVEEVPADELSRNRGWQHHSELGWVLHDAVRDDGVDGSRTFYHYEPDGARKSIHFSDKPCRIHTYGDSFTHCDQVSDGETWQEYLAAHLQEPIRNYGVGGYSVYQAFLRMRLVEREVPARWIVLNIYDDDHFRNLDAWRSIRVGSRGIVGFTLPCLRVNVEKGQVTEMPNTIPDRRDVFRLTDLNYVRTAFADDPVLKVVLARRQDTCIRPDTVADIAAQFGLSPSALADGDAATRVQYLHTQAALFATQKILEMTEEFCQSTDRKLFVILSHGRRGMRETLSGNSRWDQTLLDYLNTRPYPWIDLRDAHLADFARSKDDVDSYIKRYYIGHYSPAGNVFCAMALKDALVEWLDPAPLPYLEQRDSEAQRD